MAVEFTIGQLCALLEVSRSGYYAWLRRKPSRRQLENEQLVVCIQAIHRQNQQRYGSPRMTRQLRKEQHSCGRHRVARLMRQEGLVGLRKPAFRPRTTDSNHDQPIAPNRLKSAGAPTQPDQVWVADITYVDTVQGWIYLAVVMDLYSRRIVGWAAADHLKTSLAKAALSRALTARRPAPGLLHHSDRGVQYASGEYRSLLQSWDLTASMSAQGYCYDNAAMESFFSTLKTELIHRQQWHSLAQVNLALFNYLEAFYNRRRLHSALNYESPVDFETNLCYSKN
jgi:transposase InsO family protein